MNKQSKPQQTGLSREEAPRSQNESGRDSGPDVRPDAGSAAIPKRSARASEKERYELMVAKGYVRPYTAYAVGVYLLAALVTVGIIVGVFYFSDGQLPVWIFIALGPLLAMGGLFFVRRHLEQKISRALDAQRQ